MGSLFFIDFRRRGQLIIKKRRYFMAELQKYFNEIIPDYNVFNIIGQRLEFKKDVGTIPYYHFNPSLSGKPSEDSKNPLYRGFFKIIINDENEIKSVDELFSDDDDILQWATILKTELCDICGKNIYYVAYWCQRSIEPPQFTRADYNYILGVGF